MLRSTRAVIDPRSFEYVRPARADPFVEVAGTVELGTPFASSRFRDMIAAETGGTPANVIPDKIHGHERRRHPRQDSRSGIFFAMAIPFTACVVGLALLYGYKWDVAMEYIVSLRTSRAVAASRALSYVGDPTDLSLRAAVRDLAPWSLKRSWQLAENIRL
ncbi:hypothetical protein DL768_006904 [Monosporascus sp. mg162]|nr:hypothetical protein DL768_006904 [Monosporascus sp. mg162]